MEWTEKIQRAEKHFQQWRENGRQITARFRGKREVGYDQQVDYNIHHANGQLYISMVYPRTPMPVTRRKGERGLDVAQALEKVLTHTVDQYDLDEVIEPTMLDYYNAGLGQVIVDYVPFFKKMPAKKRLVEREGVFRDAKGKQYDDITQENFDDEGAFVQTQEEKFIYEELQFGTVPWDRFCYDPDALIWDRVEWASIEYHFSKDEFTAKFGAAKIDKVTWEARRDNESYTKDRAKVYRVFDKVDRKEIWVADNGVIESQADPWSLQQFYPFPPPLMGTVTSDNFTPVPQYMIMEPLYQELDEVQSRIFNIMSAIKVRGAYNSAFQEQLDILVKGDDNEFIPIENWSQFQGEGGLGKHLNTWPLGDLISALVTLSNQRNTIRQQIDEMTPFFDSARGGGRVEESAAMTKTKTRYSDARLNREIKKVNKFIRNLYRIAGEMISELFEAKTISFIIGAEFTEPQLAQLRDDINRDILIDVEIDADAFEDDADKQRQLTEFLNSLNAAMQTAIQAQQLQLPWGQQIIEETIRSHPNFRKWEQSKPNQLAPSAQPGAAPAGPGGGNGGQPPPP